MRKVITLFVAAVALAGLLAACSSSTKPISKSDFKKKLTDQAQSVGLTDAQASCVADKAYPKLTDSEKKAVTKGKGSKADGESFIKKLTDAAQACGVNLGASGAGAPSGSSAPSGTSGTS